MSLKKLDPQRFQKSHGNVLYSYVHVYTILHFLTKISQNIWPWKFGLKSWKSLRNPLVKMCMNPPVYDAVIKIADSFIIPPGWWQTHDRGHGPAEPSCNGQLWSCGCLWLGTRVYVEHVSVTLVRQISYSYQRLCIIPKCLLSPPFSPPCLSTTMLTSSGWWSGRLDWWAAPTTWRAPATSGSSLRVWRTRGCSVCTSSCGRSTCPNTAPSPWDTPGPTRSRGCSCYCHWLTPSTTTHFIISYF